MEIYINQLKFEGALENEKTAGEVYDGIQSWAESHNKYLLTCVVDGVEMEKSAMDKAGIDTITRIDFTIGEEADMLQAGLNELDNYIDNVGNTLYGRDSLTETEVADLKDGVEWILGMIQSAKNLLHLDLEKIKPLGKGQSVADIIEEFKIKAGKTDSPAQIEEFLESLRDLKLFVMDVTARTSVFLFSDHELKEMLQDAVNNIEKMKQEFARVNELYQSGKDNEATLLLTETSGNMNVLLTALISLNNRNQKIDYETVEIEGENFNTKLNLLNDTLAKVAAALESDDIVSAGDVLEYELPEVLDEVIPFIKQINEILQQA